MTRNAGETRRAKTPQSGLVHEHAVGEADAPDVQGISNPPTSFPTLLPCPFCAEVPRRMEGTTAGGGILMHSMADLDCPCAGQNYTVEQWSRRASPQLQSTEAVERALLKWHMPTMLRWLAENITEPRLPDGTLTGRFLYAVAENIEYRTTSPAVVEDHHD